MSAHQLSDREKELGVVGKAQTILSVKHVERDASNHKYKSRIIFRGDNMRNVLDGKPFRIEKGSAWLASASMASIFVILARSLTLNRVAEELDVESAYLQSHWPRVEQYDEHRVRPVFVRIPHDLVHMLPPHLLPPDETSASDVMWPMTHSMYGHPLSGKVFGDALAKSLTDQGWIGCPGNNALLYRRVVPLSTHLDLNGHPSSEQLSPSSSYDDAISCYVDDLMSEHAEHRAPTHDVWKHVGRDFHITRPNGEKPRGQLGQVYQWEETGEFRTVDIDMHNYAELIVRSFDDEVKRRHE
eukprot:Selendium_serpulae@DN10342_c0_g1_i1.p1